jgi:hypothetical protein
MPQLPIDQSWLSGVAAEVDVVDLSRIARGRIAEPWPVDTALAW